MAGDDEIRFAHLAAHVWFAETGTAMPSRRKNSALLGVHQGTAYYLLYNGILGDKTVNGGNVLTRPTLAALPAFDGPRVIYGEACRLSDDLRRMLGITFKQTPYDIKAR
jgi:adenine-specific DNA-methyltransferase